MITNYKHESETQVQVVDKIEWRTSPLPVLYPEAVDFMERRVNDISNGIAPETVWILEHDSIYTAGTSAKDEDLLDADTWPVYKTGRGGQYTYHGPGQRIIYVMLDLKKRGTDLRLFVRSLENWLIETLKPFGIAGECRNERIGIWVNTEEGEQKIASLGIRIRKWISYHGIAININPDLKHFNGIVPCGLSNYKMTSFENLGVITNKNELDNILKSNFSKHFSIQLDPQISNQE